MRINKSMKILTTLSIILLVAFAGCTGNVDKTISSPEGDVKISENVGTGPNWCNTGTKLTATGPTGEQAAFEIKGIVNYEGKEVCSAEWISTEGTLTQYFNEDHSYTVMIMKDKTGKVINKFDMVSPKS